MQLKQRFRKILIFIAVFGALLFIWQGALLLSLLRPTFIQTGLITAAIEEAEEGFSYPSLGINAPVTVSPATSPLETQSWAEIRQALTQGVSLAFRENSPADARLAFVTGHSSDTYPHAYSTVFAPLGQARIGDTFLLTISDSIRQYEVVDRLTLSPFAIERFEGLKPIDGQPNRVVLVTCWPPLTTAQRLVVVGEQIPE